MVMVWYGYGGNGMVWYGNGGKENHVGKVRSGKITGTASQVTLVKGPPSHTHPTNTARLWCLLSLLYFHHVLRIVYLQDMVQDNPRGLREGRTTPGPQVNSALINYIVFSAASRTLMIYFLLSFPDIN